MRVCVRSTPYFREGDPISAEKMNQNFESLRDQITGSKEIATTVDCGSGGSGINEAIAQGFNVIEITGTCRENVSFVVWRIADDQPAYKNAPDYLRLVGIDEGSKILDNSGNLSSITVDGGNSYSRKLDD